jgi:hypothetical protein
MEGPRALPVGLHMSPSKFLSNDFQGVSSFLMGLWEKIEWQKFYIGEVPPLSFFFERIEEIKRLAASSLCESGTDILAELCLIGLAAYFEAYCKVQFAAIINIYPPILQKFAEKREDCKLKVKDLLGIMPNINYRIGSLLSEQLDFGSAKEINSLFYNLLGVTPFSTDEKKLYDEFLEYRNLLAHHGGIFTMKYQHQKLSESQLSNIAQRGSLEIKKEDIQKWSEFLWGVAQKIGNSSQGAFQKKVKAEKLDDDRDTAIGLLNLT